MSRIAAQLETTLYGTWLRQSLFDGSLGHLIRLPPEILHKIEVMIHMGMLNAALEKWVRLHYCGRICYLGCRHQTAKENEDTDMWDIKIDQALETVEDGGQHPSAENNIAPTENRGGFWSHERVMRHFENLHDCRSVLLAMKNQTQHSLSPAKGGGSCGLLLRSKIVYQVHSEVAPSHPLKLFPETLPSGHVVALYQIPAVAYIVLVDESTHRVINTISSGETLKILPEVPSPFPPSEEDLPALKRGLRAMAMEESLADTVRRYTYTCEDKQAESRVLEEQFSMYITI